QKARLRVVAALKTRPPHTAGVTYYVPAALHAALSAQLAGVVRELGGRPPVRVQLLPTLAGLTAAVRPHECAYWRGRRCCTTSRPAVVTGPGRGRRARPQATP